MDNLKIINEIILQEVKSILYEIKVNQVKERLTSKKFINAYAKNVNKSFDLVNNELSSQPMVFDIILSNFLKLIPEDINENQAGESLNWLINLYISNALPHRHLMSASSGGSVTHYYKGSLETFFHWKNFYPIKQLNKFNSVYELNKMIEDNQDKIEEYKRKKSEKDWQAGTNVILDTEKWEILIPENKGAACHWGLGTKWCTAAPGLNFYEEYHSEDDPLFIIINKSNPKERYQFSFGSQQFMNTEDVPINRKEVFRELILLFAPLSDKYKVINEYFKNSIEYLTTILDKNSFQIILKSIGYDDLEEKLVKHVQSADWWQSANSFYRSFLLFQSSPKTFLKVLKTFSENGFYILDAVILEIVSRIRNGEFKLIDVVKILIYGLKKGTASALYGIINEFGGIDNTDDIINIIEYIKNSYSDGLIDQTQILPLLQHILKYDEFNDKIAEYISNQDSNDVVGLNLMIQFVNYVRYFMGDISRLSDVEIKSLLKIYNNPNQDEGLKIITKKIINQISNKE